MERQFEPEASFDGAILDDDRLLHNLIMAEEHYLITSSYFKCLQTDLKPGMRDVVANWMLEVTSITTTLPTCCTLLFISHFFCNAKTYVCLCKAHIYPLFVSFRMLYHFCSTFSSLRTLLYNNPLSLARTHWQK